MSAERELHDEKEAEKQQLNEDEYFQVFALPEKKIRISFVLDQRDYMRILAMAAKTEQSELETLTSAASIGLSLLEGDVKRLSRDVLGLKRFPLGDADDE